MEQTAVGTSANLVDDIGLEIAVDGTGDVFAVALGRVLARVSGLEDGFESAYQSRRRRWRNPGRRGRPCAPR
jgi:hypothetical protein